MVLVVDPARARALVARRQWPLLVAAVDLDEPSVSWATACLAFLDLLVHPRAAHAVPGRPCSDRGSRLVPLESAVHQREPVLVGMLAPVLRQIGGGTRSVPSAGELIVTAAHPERQTRI